MKTTKTKSATKKAATKTTPKKVPAVKPKLAMNAEPSQKKRATTKTAAAKGKPAPKSKERASVAPAKANKAPIVATPQNKRALVEDYVLFIYRGTIDPNADSLGAIAEIDPNDWDADPSPFYSTLEAVFRVEDPNRMNFGGYGGPVSRTVDFIAERWNGEDLPPKSTNSFPWDEA